MHISDKAHNIIVSILRELEQGAKRVDKVYDASAILTSVSEHETAPVVITGYWVGNNVIRIDIKL